MTKTDTAAENLTAHRPIPTTIGPSNERGTVEAVCNCGALIYSFDDGRADLASGTWSAYYGHNKEAGTK